MQPIPDLLIQHLVALDTMRCPDCWKLTPIAARMRVTRVGVGSFCDCPFDSEHP